MHFFSIPPNTQQQTSYNQDNIFRKYQEYQVRQVLIQAHLTHDIKFCMYAFKLKEVYNYLKVNLSLSAIFFSVGRNITGEVATAKRKPLHHKWKQNVQHCEGEFIPYV